MPDPVSWLQIEPGWKVVGSDGGEVGTVFTVTGDKHGDIFDGLAVGPDRAGLRYVPVEQVGAIHPGEVTLQIPASGFAGLDPFQEPPPETELKLPALPLTSRLSNWLRGRR